jgi:hypothetical protein
MCQYRESTPKVSPSPVMADRLAVIEAQITAQRRAVVMMWECAAVRRQWS